MQLQVLHANMGTMALITPGGVVRSLRRVASVVSWVVFLLLFAVFPLALGPFLEDPVGATLFVLIVIAVGILATFLLYRMALRYSTRSPQEEIPLTIRDARVRRWFHELTVEGRGKEFLLRVQGRRRALLDALALAGHPVAPWS